MTTFPQRLLNLRLDTRVALYSADFIRAAEACDAEEVIARIEAGELRWAFDVSTGSRKVRETRVWCACLLDPARAAVASLPEVIDDVIGGDPKEKEVRAARLERRWVVSDQTFRRLRMHGDISGRINGRTLWLDRQSLQGFLERRWIR